MSILDGINRWIASRFIDKPDELQNKRVRIQYGLLAGWASISVTLLLFVVKMALGLKAGSISVVANAFHLLSHLANSIILVVSFRVTARPATAKNPFGHGRMEHVAPLIMAIFLFVSGFQIGERSLHQALDPHEVHYWNALPWILLASIMVKQVIGQFVRYLGKRVHSHAILTNAVHHSIEAVMSLAVIGGLVAGHFYHHPEMDGYIGILVSLWILYLGYSHARESLVPLLGQAPSRDMIQKIREIARSVDGVEDVHEVIVHDYGSMYSISAHIEIPEKCGPAEIHEITEKAERALRKTFGGEAILHSDPLMEYTPEIKAIEDRFRKITETMPEILTYHDFRVIAESRKKRIIVADIDVGEDVPETEFGRIAGDLNHKASTGIENIAYCQFYVTPKFAY